MNIPTVFYRTVAISTLLLNSSIVDADKTPAELTGSTVVNAEELISLVREDPETTIIDSRIPSDRRQGYIEGSVGLPDVKTNCDSLALTIPRKDGRVLFYCNGINCGRSANAIKTAIQCGYDKVYWFRGGFVEWKLKDYPFLQK